MKKSFLKNVNLFSCKEKFYINFKMEEKHKGIEQIYIKNSEIDKKTVPSTFEGTEIKVALLEGSFSIKDDDNEIGSLDRIGTTITNLLNKSGNLLKILQVHLSMLEKISPDKIDELCSKVGIIIKKYGLKEYDIEQILDNLAQLTNFFELLKTNKNYELLEYEIKMELEEVKNIKTLGILYDFYQELYLLKKEYVIDELELNMLVEKLLNGDKDMVDFFSYHIPLRIVKRTIKMLKEDKHSLNEPLQYLLEQYFKDFYNDYKVVEDKQRLDEFWEISKQNYNKNPYNTYYKEISEYINNLNNQFIEEMKEYKKNHDLDKIVTRKFMKFSYQDMAVIFLKSFIYDLNFMNDNYDKELEFTYINMVNKTKNEFEFQISSWRELFYISNHYILEEKHKLRKCKLCHRFFIAEKLNRDKNCQRKYKDKKTCREYANKNYRGTQKLIDPIGTKVMNIEKALNELTELNKIEIEEFTQILNKSQSIQNDDNLTEEEKTEKLTKIHNQLKKRKKEK